jgi:hypothetical protein
MFNHVNWVLAAGEGLWLYGRHFSKERIGFVAFWLQVIITAECILLY